MNKTPLKTALDALGAYNAQTIEAGTYHNWEANGYFAPDFDRPCAYCIALPPPNVTGSLHMGHGFNNTIMDTLIRYQRMMGKNTLWQAGTDHAGIATQMVVERRLGAQGIARHDLGRTGFLDEVWKWKEESGDAITRQIRRLGSSVDWTRERFTMDEGLSRAVQEVFCRLYDDGLIYRGKRLVNWDVALETALSDLEVENHDEAGHLWHFRYALADNAVCTHTQASYLVVATTRPETLLGDSAIAVHPEDARYAHLIGKEVILPISGRRVPIVADTYVEQDFGTGCVKITPAHDFNDYELGRRHNLPLINIFDKNARILPNLEVYQDTSQKDADHISTPEGFSGLSRFDARAHLVKRAQLEGWLEKIEPYTLKAPRGDRSGQIVEPYLTDQWYVSIEALAAPAIEAVEDGRIAFVPAQYKNMYMSWMRDIQDWCISRQLWWGHRIPAWYDEAGNVYVGRDEDSIRQKYNLDQDVFLTQDEDVLDTWFSSALWTFSTLGWTGDAKKDRTNEFLQTFHPTDVLVTGFDIIFFWVARMIMMTLYFIKDEEGCPQVPFKTVYVHGLVRDGQGQKMSKSKGNVLDPIDLIDGICLEDLITKRTAGLMNPKQADAIKKDTQKEFPDGLQGYGTDALRFTFASLASTGRDINFDLKRIEGSRNFCNKIHNATRFVLMNCIDKDGMNLPIDTQAKPALWGVSERWIVTLLQETTAQVHKQMQAFRFDLVAQSLYEFAWNGYCDWYVELAKSLLNDPDTPEDKRAQIRFVLLDVLEQLLRLLHPIMPYITEHLWQTIAPILDKKTHSSIMLASYPVVNADAIYADALTDMAHLQALIGAIRNIRGEMKLSPAKRFEVLIEGAHADDKAAINRVLRQFLALAKVEKVRFLTDHEKPPLSSKAMVGHISLLVPMKGLIDPTAEIVRLQKTKDKLQKQVDVLSAKLSNEGFLSKAPPDLVQKEQAKANEARAQIAALDEQVVALESL